MACSRGIPEKDIRIALLDQMQEFRGLACGWWSFPVCLSSSFLALDDARYQRGFDVSGVGGDERNPLWGEPKLSSRAYAFWPGFSRRHLQVVGKISKTIRVLKYMYFIIYWPKQSVICLNIKQIGCSVKMWFIYTSLSHCNFLIVF